MEIPLSLTLHAPHNAAAKLTGDCYPLTAELCAQLQFDWAELAQTPGEPNIFQFPQFISHSLVLLAEHSPQLVAIREEGLLIGIVILRRDTGYAKLPVPFWRSALHHEQFLGTPLVRSGYEDAFAKGLCAWLDNAPRDCWFINLSMLSADGPVAQAILRHCNSNRRQVLRANLFERAAIAPREHSASNADELLSTSRRKSLRKAMKRLDKEGEITIECLSDAQSVKAWTEEFLDLENTGWKQKNGSSILSCKHEAALYRAVIAEAFAAGTLHFSRMCLDGRPIAYTLDIAGYCLKSAIDERARKFSPGVLMEYNTLKHYLAAEEFPLVDSCSAPGNAMLNELWPDRKAIADMVIARRGALYNAAFWAIKTIKTVLNTAGRA